MFVSSVFLFFSLHDSSASCFCCASGVPLLVQACKYSGCVQVLSQVSTICAQVSVPPPPLPVAGAGLSAFWTWLMQPIIPIAKSARSMPASLHALSCARDPRRDDRFGDARDVAALLRDVGPAVREARVFARRARLSRRCVCFVC